MPQSQLDKTNYLPLLTFEEIEEKVSQIPALILPIGGLEPVNIYCSLGIVNEVTAFISNRIAERCGVLLAPLLSYSNTTAYRAFGGSVGVKKNIFESSVVNMVNDSSSWGIRKLFIFDGTFGSYTLLQKTIARIEKRRTNKVTIFLFNWQREETIRTFIEKNLEGKELGRSEFGIMSIAAYFKPYLIRPLLSRKKKKGTLDKEVYNRWLKRGEDPHKFRRLFPHCTTSFIKNKIDPQFGKALLDVIVDYYGNSITNVISPATGKPIKKVK
jgi:creatinine amidohydrolase/Fe(II)-dependent formamide hydrolase-like protein